MKNYIIGALIVALIMLSSIIYKNESASGSKFPVTDVPKSDKAEFPMLLYVFLNEGNCFYCREIVEVLNNLPPHFSVIGLVSEEELKDEAKLRNKSQAKFPLMSSSKFRKFFPSYFPTIVGVSPSTKKVIFTLPGVPGEEVYLETFLESLYEKLYPRFSSKKVSKGTQIARRLQ